MTQKRPRLQMLKPALSIAPTLAEARGLKTVSASDSWRTGKSAAARGYDRQWRKARERFLRAHPTCAMCEAEGQLTAATLVDHKVPHRGDQALFWDETNWQSLCRPHHDRAKKQQEAQEAREGRGR